MPNAERPLHYIHSHLPRSHTINIPIAHVAPRQQVTGPPPRLLRQKRIHEHQRRHTLNNGHRTRHNTRIMSPLRLQHTLLPIIARRRLRLPDRGRRLERNGEVDVAPVADAALNAAAVVRLGGERRPRRAGIEAGGGRRNGRGGDEGVVVYAARYSAAAEAGTDLEAFGRGDGEHGVREQRFELVEARFSEPWRNVADDARYSAADAVLSLFELLHQRFHARGGLFVRAADGVEGVDFFAGDGVEEGEEFGVRGGSWVYGRGREEEFGADA